MLEKLIEFSLKNRFLVIIAVLAMAAAGARSALMLPIDAVPDLTNTQVTVITPAGSLPPVGVERLVTYPIEWAMGGLPDVEEIRSVSKFGLSVITIVFNEGTDVYFANHQVNQRLSSAAASIPDGYGPPELGPMTTALGEILQFEVRSDLRSPLELRTLLDWEIAPKLRQVDGVTEINVMGGFYQTFEVRPDPDSLMAQGLTFAELYERIENANASAGGGYVVHHDEQRFIRGEALLSGVDDIGDIVLRRSENGSPLLVSDIADVSIEAMPRQGAVSRDGRGEAVTGMVMMRIGENSRDVVGKAKKRIDEIRATLPSDVTLEIIYDRESLINRTLQTVMKNLLEGGVLVAIVLLLTLGSLRAGIIVALAIPLSMLFATNMMWALGISASLMSLGAIDFGLIVDSSVIMVENCVRRLSNSVPGKARLKIIRDACVEVRGPTMFGELIIAIVYVPVLLLEGTEGKMFRPMALTVLCALFGSFLLSMTLMPALSSLALPKQTHEKDLWLIRMLKKIYLPTVGAAIASPLVTTIVAFGIFAVSIPVALNLGAEFMPRLNEGDLLVEAVRLPSASLEGAEQMAQQIESHLLALPEVATVFTKTGRPEIANDVMGVHQSDVWVMLHPPDRWPTPKTREELIGEMEIVLNENVPGVAFGFTQPIEMRVDELVAGVKADVAILIYGDDLDTLAAKAKQIERTLKSVPGAADVKADIQSTLETLTIEPDRSALARYGIEAKQVMDVVAAIGGRPVGEVLDGRARFPIRVRLPALWRDHVDKLNQLPVSLAGGKPVPLYELATIRLEQTPPTVEHEDGRRRTFVSANVRGRDVASFVADAMSAVESDVKLPVGYELHWGGDFENLQSAGRRLAIITPMVLIIIFMLLFTSFGSLRLATLIFTCVPIAASGGIFALALRQMPFSIAAGVGFIALLGVAVLNGLVWVADAENHRKAGRNPRESAKSAANDRLRPVLMTAMVASLGFLPMALSTSDGAELQRPLATVVIGGLVTSTLLTCIVIPAIYPWFAQRSASPSDSDPTVATLPTGE
ncbi:efflux RND transporter permease subunit [Rhodopirellula sallentina]|uniref:Heavy metal efflux pump, CzcA family n=1 Tax=Rhodopirellula sallentina SM41 TaxID=1263870 RepID=M5ULC4_9BACT|nr:CusA/CzcA family heavy metal efflux RND transporter [Rhodopirellula sallentina]EMI56818.1 heavy metal efflux pump, CzcA family [Rhodopirellula sallentina SM41]